jgi:aquaporin NIP
MNPVRSLAPALVSMRLGEVWIYLVAPLFGALVAVATCSGIRGKDCCTAEAECA